MIQGTDHKHYKSRVLGVGRVMCGGSMIKGRQCCSIREPKCRYNPLVLISVSKLGWFTEGGKNDEDKGIA